MLQGACEEDLPNEHWENRKDKDPISAQELSAARGLVGALQWPATQGVPILCASMSMQAGEIPKGTIKGLKEFNKSLRFAQQRANLTLKFMAKNGKKKNASLEEFCLVCYADAAFCVRADKTSQGGL